MRSAIEEVINCIDDCGQDYPKATLSKIREKLQSALDNSSPEVSLKWDEKLADEILGILYKHKSDESDDGSWINSSDYYKVAAAVHDWIKTNLPSKEASGMKWVKASERTPEHNSHVFIRYKQGAKSVALYQSFWNSHFHWMADGRFIDGDIDEWLDEGK